jgi:hypothetical protein
MGGTMLGVAPQGGAVAPPAPELTATPPPVRTTETSSLPDAHDAARAVSERANPFAGTFELPRAESAPVEATVGSAPDPSSAIGPGHTRPFVMSGVTAGPGHTRPLSIGDVTSGAGHTRPLEALEPDDAQPEAGAAPAPVAPTPALASVADGSVPAEALAAPDRSADDLAVESRLVPPRLRALDVILIVCTLGLYGLVIWARQRRSTQG